MDILNLVLLILLPTTVSASTTTPPATCTSPVVSDATYLPNQPTFNDGETVTYTCDTGYELTSGVLVLTCSTGAWAETTPVCSIKTCAAADIPFGTRTPLQAQYNYNTDVTYSCDVGYTHASGDLVRTCQADTTWGGTEPVCQIVTCAVADAAFASRLPVTSDINYSASVTYTCDVGYEVTSGSAVRTCQASGDLTGTVPVCSIITCSASDINFATKAPASAAIDYNTSVTYTCDVGYNVTSGDVVRTCEASGDLSGATPVCTIITCSASDINLGTKAPSSTAIDYNTSVTYICDVGYYVSSGDAVRTCQASGDLSGATPVCTLITCSTSDINFATKAPASAAIDYNTSVTYTCDVGYNVTSGDVVRTCEASGDLSGATPVCTIITCSASDINFATKAPASAAIDYNTSVRYTCDVGYDFTSGDTVRTCQASGDLTGTPIICTIRTCSASDINFATRAQASAAIDYNTNVTYTCDVGYDVTSGDAVRTCEASGELTGSPPNCTIVTCQSANTSFATKTPASAEVIYNTDVTYTCDVGYEITSGNAIRTCQASGDMSGALPSCTIITCASSDVTFGSKLPTAASIAYNTSVTYTCDVGYDHTSGDTERTCQASGDLSGALPVCTIKTCTPDDATHATRTPTTATIDYNQQVVYACNLGYEHTAGDLTRTCQADTTWTGVLPTCTIVTCTEPANITLAEKSPIQSSYDYNTAVVYTCQIGYERDSGDLTRTCQADRTWSGTLPACTIVECAAPSAVANSLLDIIADPYTYSTTITYTCITGYEYASGSLSRTCQANHAFSGTAPVCTIKQCAKVDVANGTIGVDQALYDYGTSVTYSCNLGFNHTAGDLTRTCNATALWTGMLPVCTVAACLPEVITYGTYSPTGSTTQFNTVLTYTCDLGYYISAGDANRTCNTDGTWSNTLPTCSLVQCTVPVDVFHSSRVPTGTLIDYNNDVTYTCDLAYNHTAGDLVRTCKEDFSWNGMAPTCTISACIQEDSTYMTTTPDQTLHQFGDVIVYQCILGYNHSSGDLTRTCQNDGNWTGVKPECAIVTCDIQNVPAHASVVPDVAAVDYNMSISYVCDLGYNRTDGDETRRCTETAAFEGIEANCTLVTCDTPDAISYGTYSPMLSVYDYNMTVNFSCDFGYYLFSGDLIQRCDENANWVNPKPVCKIVQCTKPTEPYTTVSPDQTLYDFNTTVTSSCILGYNLTDGDSTRTCLETADWDGTPPNCTIVECDAPPPVPISTLSPVSSRYVYQDVLTYTCDIGYEVTSGSATRTCTETKAWTGEAPNCTVIHCPIPPDGVRNTYAPALSDYIWNDNVTYSCDIGYYHFSGDLNSICLHDKTWSAVTPLCKVVTCNKIDIPLMTFDPPTPDTHDFNTTIEYSCVVGYNHSYGDLFRTCDATGQWNGTLPNCTIITCDPPDPIPNTSYLPVQVEHDWNTAIEYSCDDNYHYVSGLNFTTCNESGSFPPATIDCSVQHYITIDPSEPDITWINSTVKQAGTIFNFDGICDVTIVCFPVNRIDVTHTISGNQLTMTVSETASSLFQDYRCRLSPFRGDRTFNGIKRKVFYGNAIDGFMAWLDNSQMYVEIGQPYHFEANATAGSGVNLIWTLEDGINHTYTTTDEFSYMDFTYTFSSSREGVSANISNSVSEAYVYIPLFAIYDLNGFDFTVNDVSRTTTEVATFVLDLDAASNIPMAEVKITITLQDGNAPVNVIYDIQDSLPVSFPLQYDVTYSTQGYYNVTLVIENPLSSITLSKNMSVWDELDGVRFQCVTNCPILETNSTIRLQFWNTPPAGFEYSIETKDKNDMIYANHNSSILYKPYDLSYFNHIYTLPGRYRLRWSVWNDAYSKIGVKWITVQNKITDFQAWLDNSQMYVEIGQPYHFEANATAGSEVTLIWTLEDGINHTYITTDEFSYMDFTYTFSSSREGVSANISNSVSEAYVYIPLFAIYDLNGFDFTVNDVSRTTTEVATFVLDLDAASNIPMAEVKITITLQDGNAPVNVIYDIQDSLPVSFPLQYDVTYSTQGYYNVTLVIENPLSSITLSKNMSVWDELDGVRFQCVTNCPILETNSTIRLQFWNTPPAGFEYSIETKDKDDTIYSNHNSSILYKPYDLSYFDHIYTLPGRYRLRWSVWNDAYSKIGAKWITVQNKITDFQAYLDNPIIYLAVGDTYEFIATATDGTTVTLDWNMEENIIVSQNYTDSFTYGNLSYAFQDAKHNVSVQAWNLVSSATVDILVEVFYRINNFMFTVASPHGTLGNTTEPVLFDLHLLSNANLPMHIVNITVDFKHGTPVSNTTTMDESYGVDINHFYTHLFDIQGTFTVEATVENIFGAEVYSIDMRVWDSLLPLELDFVNRIGTKYIKTNDQAEFNFTNVPNHGFKYSIDYGDGTIESDTADTILYAEYNLGVFTHTYTSPGVYIVHWIAYNGEPTYGRDERFPVHVQNPVPDANYTLDPVGKKYPWTVVQTLDIGLNITLNSSVPIPTNATCIFSPDDGSNSVADLVYDAPFFEYVHQYRDEGIFDSTLNCSNDVSNYIYVFDVEVRKFIASELSLVFHNYVPLNYSDSVTVYFHVDNGGYQLLPLFVYLTWDYGDGTTSRRRRASLLYDQQTYSHVYTERGNYTVTVHVEAQASTTTNTVSYSLRLGLMYFEYNTTVQFLNTTLARYTMYGVKGAATYTVYFDDDTPDEQCSSSGFSSCDIHHYCPHWGYKEVMVVATNGSFIEVDNMTMTCDNPIVNLTMDIPYTVAIPNGTIDARLRIKQNDLFLPRLFCTWNMGDPIKRDTYTPKWQMVTYEDPYLFNFQYLALGRQTITINCWNLINDTRLETQITVTNKDFLFTGVFDRFYSQIDSPMYISSMRDTEIFSRMEIVAASHEKTHTNEWIIDADLNETDPSHHGLLFTRGLLPETKYNITLKVCFVEEPGNCIFEPTYAEFIMPPPHAEIVGSSRRYETRKVITIDAYTLSYDPVKPDMNSLVFTWDCEAVDASSFENAISKLGGSGDNCTYFITSSGVVSLHASANPQRSHYGITVTVDNTRGMTAQFTQIIAIEAYKPLTIKCKINCLSKVARSSKVQLVPDLSSNCQASYVWSMKKWTGSSYVSVNLEAFTSSSGSSSCSLTILENKLEFGAQYLITLEVTRDGVVHGPAYYEFLTNRPPHGGVCSVIPFNVTTLIPLSQEVQNTTESTAYYKLNAGIDFFNITCEHWEDEGFTSNTFTTRQPLLYMFFLSFGDIADGDTKRQLVYFDPGQTSNLVTFQVGNVNDEYKARLVIRIVDVIGDYTDVTYNVKSVPSLTTAHLANKNNDAIYNIVSDYVGQFDEDLIKANRTYDYRTLSRKIMDISSVYNELALNVSSGVILSPEDLLSLGYVKNEDDQLLSWQDYWKIIVEVTDSMTADYLVQTGEKYAYMLHAAVESWPPTKRMTLVAIETISRALNASTSQLDYSNVTAAILGAKAANILTRNLAIISDDRTFPNTEHLFSAAISVRDLIRNVLSILQTVLTPNLPQDPSVDEMRNYLEYIKIFKTTEEVLNAPLSIQEQTFLAQKQLQKYHLQKYIKSEASKNALPHLTYALRNLTYILGRMSVIGQEELFLENDFVYISVEVTPAYKLVDKTVNRPRVAIELNQLQEDNPVACNSSEIILRTIVFKHNPYFWGQFADRITSYVPLFEIDGATLKSPEITYRLENEVEAVCKDQRPTYEEDDPDKMIYILFDRQHAEDDILIFVRPNTSELIYELYFNKDEKPKITENLFSYRTEMKQNDETWTIEDGYKLRIKSSEYSEIGKIWIGLRPLLENSADLSLLTRKFCANVTSVSCLAWVPKGGIEEYEWDKERCEVSLSSTLTETYCTCRNDGDILTVGTTFYVPYNMIDFKSLDELSDAVGRMPVIGMMAAIFIAYVILVIWAWREDVKDQYKWSYSLMIDNDIADSYFYIIRVFTGLRTGAGTESKVGFVLVGEDGDTNIRIMDDDSHIGFERGSVRTFVMSSRKYLGDLLCLRIWHDDTGGNNSSWYLNKITVTDLKSSKRFVFVCNQWLDHDSGDTRVDRVLHARPYADVRSYQDMVSYTVAENHLWISVFVRPMKSNFTRIQRLSCLLGLIYLAMIICTIILEKPDVEDDVNNTLPTVVIGPFRFSMKNFKAALIAVTVSSIIIIIVSFFFKNAESEESAPNLDSVLRRAYRKVNKKLKFDTSVLSTRYWSPAESALEYNYFFLPHMCVYVAWTILVMSLAVATYLLVSFSSDWALIKSEEWMTAVFVAMLCSILLIEGAKLLIILLAYSLLCQRAYEPPEPEIAIDSLEEITKYNSATLLIGPQFHSVLHKPENPSKATLVKNQIKRIRNHQLLKIVSHLIAYSALLYLVYTISYESRDPRSFYLKDHVENLFHFNSEVTDLKSYTDWLKGTFIDTYFSNTFFGAQYEGNENRMYMQDLSNMRIGPARLRQLRIRPEDCIGPLGVNLTCRNKYEETKKETQDFCLRWQPQPCPVTEKSTYFTSPAWEYRSAKEVWGFPTVAQYCTYGGGGYFMKLDVNRDVCEIIFDELVQFSWFDDQTRAVILEFTLYNANTNLFVYSKFVAEFPEVGGFLPYIDIQVFRLYLNSGADGQFILFLQFFFFLFVIAATFVIVYEVSTDFRAFFRSAWNILDLIALIMSYTTISIFIYKIFIINKTINVFENDKNAYVGFENLAFYDFITNTAFGILVFLLSVRVSRILGYSGKINEMADVITSAATDLYGFLLIFAITYFAYVICGTILFGKEQEKYKDLFQTYGTLTEAIIGKNRVSNILLAKPGYAEFYYFTFVLFVLMTLATMAAAILNFSISEVRAKQQKLAPTNIVEVIFDRLGKLVDKIMPSHDKEIDSKNSKRRDSDAEISAILADLRVFISGIRSDNSKPSDKYKLTDNEEETET